MQPSSMPFVLALALAACATFHDDPAPAVPAPVTQTLRAEAGTAPLDAIEREGPRYEASWRDDDGRHEVEVTADGQVVEREDELAPDEVPAVVTAALAASVPDVAGVRWVRHTRPATGAIFFEAALQVDGERRELQFAADGSPTTDREDEDDGDDGHDGVDGDDDDT